VHWRDHTRSETGPHDLRAAGWQEGPSRLNDNYSIRFEMKKHYLHNTVNITKIAVHNRPILSDCVGMVCH